MPLKFASPCGYSYGNNPSSGDYESYYHCTDRTRTVTKHRQVPDKWYVTIEACKKAKDCDSKKTEVSQTTYDKIHEGDLYNRKTGKITKQ